jgi:hypothetical protein
MLAARKHSVDGACACIHLAYDARTHARTLACDQTHTYTHVHTHTHKHAHTTRNSNTHGNSNTNAHRHAPTQARTHLRRTLDGLRSAERKPANSAARSFTAAVTRWLRGGYAVSHASLPAALKPRLRGPGWPDGGTASAASAWLAVGSNQTGAREYLLEGRSVDVHVPHLRPNVQRATQRCQHATRRTPHITRRTPHITRGTPHKTRGTPHKTRGTPHKTRGMQHAACNTQHAACNI